MRPRRAVRPGPGGRDALRAPADAAGAAHGGDGAGRHAADRAPRDRRGAAPGRGRAAVQRDFCAGRRPAGAAADLHRASTHWLRHTFANDGPDAGVDIRDMQELLGHASLGTTTLYTKADSAPPVPVGPDLFQRGARRCGRAAWDADGGHHASVDPGVARRQRGSCRRGADGRRAGDAEGGAEACRRGCGRVVLEREVLAGVSCTPIRDGVTMLQVPFDDDDAFDRRVDDLLVAIALTAEQHRCTSESEAWAEWPAYAGGGNRRGCCRRRDVIVGTDNDAQALPRIIKRAASRPITMSRRPIRRVSPHNVTGPSCRNSNRSTPPRLWRITRPFQS
ncbi:tyrosine-type recombinase/integrase [Burkholderia ambifaria]|uniref:tyrosine-type recombinase/integrase n=1 Tax=Burkholderia ambifaria TaxID=152480 RepID=UPI001FC80760|nr:tyrosine-type recombinase/integrase [Burkholderia ambifaria]